MLAAGRASATGAYCFMIYECGTGGRRDGNGGSKVRELDVTVPAAQAHRNARTDRSSSSTV